MKRLLQIFIATIPLIISFSTSDPALAIRFLVLSIFISGVLIYQLYINQSIYKQIIMHPAIISFGFMIIFYLISSFFNGFGSESIYVVIKLAVSYIFLIILVNFIIKDGYYSLLNSFIYFSILLSAIYFLQMIIAYSDTINLDSAILSRYNFNKIASTMGNRNLLSSIQFLMMPVLIYLFITAKKRIKILSSAAILLILIILFHTQTRAVIFALIIFFCSMLILHKNKISKAYWASLFLVISLLLASSYLAIRDTKNQHIFIENTDRSIAFKSSNRYKLYKSSVQLIYDNPIFGVGPGNWKVKIGKYGLYQSSVGKSFAQRPHNDFLWVFSEGGLIPGILYLLLFLILLRDSYLLYKHRKGQERLFYSLLFSCFLGFGFISMVDFPMERLSHTIIFFVLASFVISARTKKNKTKMSIWFRLMLIVISLFAVYIATIRFKGDIYATKAIYYKTKARWGDVINSIEKSYNKNYYEIENTSTPLLWFRGLAYFNQQRYDLALQDFKGAYELNPYHVHVINNLATCYGYYNNYTKSKELYKECISISPMFEIAALNLAMIYSHEERDEEALDVLLGVRNFHVENSSNLSEIYIKSFNTIFKKLTNRLITNKKSVKLASNKKQWFAQIKQLYLMRKEHQTYSTIITSNKL
tara:strand:+ start:25906 stop:27840 length:1935 start_codon:yes stop_codon:yes gene_type:complete